MNNNSDDNNKDKADQANTSAHEKKADKCASAKETLNKIIYKTGVLAGKAFALAKSVTKDVVQELRNLNTIRKETVATAAEGTKKTDLAKTFWTKTSGKQRGIIFSIIISITILVFVAIRDGEDWNYLLDICVIPNGMKPIQACSLKSARASENWVALYTVFTSKHEILTIDYGSKYPTNLKRNEQTIQMPATYKKMGEKGLIQVTRIAPNNCTQIDLYKRDDKKRIFKKMVSQKGGCIEEQRLTFELSSKNWFEIQYILNR